MWGQLAIKDHRQTFSNSEDVIDQFRQEQSDAFEVQSWQALEQLFGIDTFNGFNGNLNDADISSTGIFIDDIIYLKPCNTRYGQYPYCQSMRHGAYSTTKSMAAAVALFRLAQKYGDDVGHLLIKTARSQMAEKPKSGRLYKIKGRKHRASAPGESPANITRALSKSIGYQTGNLSMQFGAGGRGSGVNYASYLEDKLDRPLLQNAVEKNEGSIEHIFQSTLSSFITKGS